MVKQFIPKIDISEVLMRNILLDFEENALNCESDDSTIENDDSTIESDNSTAENDHVS